MKIGLSSAAYYGQLETDEAAAHIAGAAAGHLRSVSGNT